MKTRWQDWINLVLGIWLFFSPWMLQFTDMTNAALNAYVLGAGIIVFSVWALFNPKVWEERINFIFGLWLFVSPWVLGFTTDMTLTLNVIVIGIAVALLSVTLLVTHWPLSST
ncbi:MAG TPA: SPW repeat protein [Burkholderiales bacterium]|nr:SPW repeat protein [Burkholderiales bacterium]